jgi:alkylation response protein AidB-like acyl-CoA dehydrogenase
LTATVTSITPPSTSAASDPVAAARALVPLLARHAAAAEQARQASAEAIEAIRAAGLFQTMFPRRTGGAGHLLITQVETIATLARGCPGTAWAFGLLMSVTASAASMGAAVRERVFQTGNELVCSVAGQIGTARAVEGGYIVNGSWAYGSGCMLSLIHI